MSQTVKDKAALLKQVGLFKYLEDKDVKRLATQFELKKMAPDSIVIKEGDKSREFFIIVSGFLNVTTGAKKKPILLSVLGPKDFFGEAALFHNAVRSASVWTSQNVELLVIKKTAFDRFLQSNAVAARRILYQFVRVLLNRTEQLSYDLKSARAGTLSQESVDRLLDELDGMPS